MSDLRLLTLHELVERGVLTPEQVEVAKRESEHPEPPEVLEQDE